MAHVLITGASTGIGLSTALVLGRAGHTVTATMRNPTRAPALKDTAERERLPVSVLEMDVSSDQSVGDCFTRVREPVDVLINNAGVGPHGSVEELSLDVFRAAMEVNYFGAVRCIKAVLPQMRAARAGCIINISSVAGRIACPPFAAYSPSKAALEALSETLAGEVKPFNIRVAIVEPGIMDTAMARGIEVPPQTAYPQVRRFSGLFRAALAHPTSPDIAAATIREIVESDTWQLRHPSGPDAAPFLAWRASMTDEQWVDFSAQEDESWYERVQQDFGLNARAS